MYDQKWDIFLVALVMQHPTPGEAQLPVALMLTNLHGTPDYMAFLSNWWWSMRKSNPEVCKPLSITTDFNWPSVHALCLVFNGCDVIRHLRTCKAILCHKLASTDLNDFTVVGLGCAHFVHALVRWTEMKSVDHLLQFFWQCLLTSMISMTMWFQLKSYFKHIVIILCAGMNL